MPRRWRPSAASVAAGEPIPYVLDTSVLVSAALGKGHSRRLLSLLVARTDLISSEAILSELDETLRSEKRLARLIPATTRARYLAFLARAARLVNPSEVGELPDPDDAHVFGTAAAAGATLVTGDKALVSLSIEGVRVLTVRQALEELGSQV